MNLFLIRHLPTLWNNKGLLQGSRDISIIKPKENVIEEINFNKKLLSSEKFDFILVSTLKRTHETAILYGFTNFTEEPLLNELNFGIYEGKKKEEMLKVIGPNWINNPRSIELGESLVFFEKRIVEFLNKYKGLNLLIFSHGAVIRAISALINNGTINKMNTIQIDNNSLTILKNEGINCSQ